MNKLYLLGFLLYFFVIVNAKFCTIDSDCNSDSKCSINGLCTCEEGKVISSDGTRCLEVAVSIGSECVEDIQCLSWITGPSVCTKDFLCGCKPGHIYINNACTEIEGYNGVCNTNLDCYDGINFNALKCKDKECICNDNYYVRGESDCRLSGKENKKCLFDIDCESNVECCEFQYGPLGDCVSKLDSNNTCSGIKPPEKSFYQAYENINYSKKNNGINKKCDTNINCIEIENSFCPEFNKKCTCKDGFLYNKYKNSCVAGLGSSCVGDEDCLIPHSSCNENNICTCKDYFVNSIYNDKCFKPARGLYMSCGRDENCYSLGIHGICNENKCDCSFNSEYDEELMLCKPTNNPINNGCKDNCNQKPHSTCVINKCECDENYESVNNTCLPDIGFECNEQQGDCVIKNAECKNKKCECKEGYIKNDNRTCIERITEEDECTTDIQCELVYGTGGMCLNKNCTCQPEYMKMIIEEKNTCVLKRTFGEQCTLSIHCKTLTNNNHVVCRNSKCECDYDYQLIEDENGQRCENGSSVLLISNVLIWVIIGILLAFN